MSTAVDNGNEVYLGCESCGLVSPAAAIDDPALVQQCPRCGHALVATKPDALQRTWDNRQPVEVAAGDSCAIDGC